MDLDSRDYAVKQDEKDSLRDFRKQFIIPSRADLQRKTLKSDRSNPDTSGDCTYLCGNSLGLQPVLTRTYLQQYLDTWATKGVFGHFKDIEDSNLAPFVEMDEDVLQDMAQIVGAKRDEVAVMGTLTSNLHFMMASFFKPTKKRWKIILEGKAFPSDHVRDLYNFIRKR